MKMMHYLPVNDEFFLPVDDEFFLPVILKPQILTSVVLEQSPQLIDRLLSQVGPV